ncbi:hypothetical protein AAMO2058_001529100 [Amorphochlora amoebiformis]
MEWVVFFVLLLPNAFAREGGIPRGLNFRNRPKISRVKGGVLGCGGGARAEGEYVGIGGQPLVIGRQRGISVKVCTDIITGRAAERARTVAFGDRPFLQKRPICQEAQETSIDKKSLDSLCLAPCKSVCTTTVERFVSEKGDDFFLETGMDVGGSQAERLVKRCVKSCKNQCNPRLRAEPEGFFEVSSSPGSNR